MIFDRYILKSLSIATIFIALTLAAVILLTQSLRFLELVIESGASSSAFWILTLLALPRFFEIILPIALMAATVFLYNKMTMDSELVVMRANGVPPMALARPALIMALITTIVLWGMTMWVGPASLASMQQMRQVIKAQYSTLLFREGVFNAIVPGLTVFIRDKEGGELKGMVIHDSRDAKAMPSTVIAKRGLVTSTDDGQQVLVYDGSRQTVNAETGVLERLNFERYSIDLPDGSGTVRQRWAEPDERTIWELLHPDKTDSRDVESKSDFFIEIHRRIASPLLAPAFVVIVLNFLLLGPVDRRGQFARIAMAIITTVSMQGLYLVTFNIALKNAWGLIPMYALVLVPLVLGLFMLSEAGEDFRRRMLYSDRRAA